MSPKPLIVAATTSELAPSIPFLREHAIPYLVTGAGMLATAYALTKRLRGASPPAYILNVGIAGSFTPHLAIGAVTEIVHDTLPELGAESEEGFIPMEQLGFGNSSWSNIPPSALQTHLPPTKAVTVNTVHGVPSSIESIRQQFPEVQVESMEGAAVFYVCHSENIPCLQVRSISNYVELRNKSTWNIPLAIHNLNEWLMTFLAS